MGADDPVVVTVEALNQQVATLTAQVRTATAELEMARGMQHLIAHEVRTPLTVILAALSTLRHADLPDAERERLEGRALANAERLRAVIDDLTARDVHVRAPLPRTPLDTVPLLTVLRSATVGDATIRVHGDETQMIATAPERLRALVRILVDNACTHGVAPIELHGGAARGEVVVTVADRGPGLRGASPTAWFAPPGSGLFLARHLTRSLGGELTLADRAGGGLLATVVLPQRRSGDPRPSVAPAARGPRPRRRDVAPAR